MSPEGFCPVPVFSFYRAVPNFIRPFSTSLFLRGGAGTCPRGSGWEVGVQLQEQRATHTFTPI